VGALALGTTRPARARSRCATSRWRTTGRRAPSRTTIRVHADRDCVLLDGASLDLAPRGGGLVQLRHLVVTNSSVGLGGVSFVVEGCAFNGSGLQIADCPQGGLVYGCAFEGTLASGATSG